MTSSFDPKVEFNVHEATDFDDLKIKIANQGEKMDREQAKFAARLDQVKPFAFGAGF